MLVDCQYFPLCLLSADSIVCSAPSPQQTSLISLTRQREEKEIGSVIVTFSLKFIQYYTKIWDLPKVSCLIGGALVHDLEFFRTQLGGPLALGKERAKKEMGFVIVLIPHGREGKITFCSPDAQGQTKKSKPEGLRPEGGFFCLPEGGGRGPTPKGKLKIQAQGPKARGRIFCLPEGLGPGPDAQGPEARGRRASKKLSCPTAHAG